ncbi:hypothetical protein RFI_31165, partial [Reticulomyxa filosa]
FLAISKFVIHGELQEPVLQQKSKGFCLHFNTIKNTTINTGTLHKGSLSFAYSCDFNTNGVCNRLGMNKGADTWQSPALCGHILVLYSSFAADSKPARCVKDPKELPWFVIYFKNINIIPANYPLKYFIIFDNEFLQNWKFKASDGSTDDVNGQYVALITNNNDQSPSRKGATHTWTITYHIVMNQTFSNFDCSNLAPIRIHITIYNVMDSEFIVQLYLEPIHRRR